MYLTGKPDGHEILRLVASDGTELPLRHWKNRGAPALVLYLPGMGDHSGSFTWIGDRLAAEGIEVLALDSRGFGLSDYRPRGDICSFDSFIEDAALVLREWISRGFRGSVIAAGLSMGGGLALRLAAEHPGLVNGVVALAPGLGLRRTPAGFVLKVLAAYVLCPQKRFASPFSLQSTTGSREALERIESDERWLRAFSARFWVANLRHLWRLKSLAGRICCPVQILLPERDRVVSPKAAREFLRSVASSDKTVEVILDSEHNLAVDPKKAEVADTVSRWIRNRFFRA